MLKPGMSQAEQAWGPPGLLCLFPMQSHCLDPCPHPEGAPHAAGGRTGRQGQVATVATVHTGSLVPILQMRSLRLELPAWATALGPRGSQAGISSATLQRPGPSCSAARACHRLLCDPESLLLKQPHLGRKSSRSAAPQPGVEGQVVQVLGWSCPKSGLLSAGAPPPDLCP